MINNNSSDGRSIISGKVIFNEVYKIISGDEDFYRFVSPVTRKIIDAIHQVDLDDFYEVLVDLSTYSTKTMVLRMRRFDNSYRWVLAVMKRIVNENEQEYTEMEISDIINLHNHYLALTNVFDKKANKLDYNDIGSLDDMLSHARKFNQDNRDVQINLGLIELDNYDNIVEQYGKEVAEEIRNDVVLLLYEALEDATLISHDDRGIIGFYALNLGIEVNVRSLIEAVRRQLQWKYISQNRNFDISFTIGISEYPKNGKDIELVIKKMHRAYELAISKGRGRFIIYKEELHGEI